MPTIVIRSVPNADGSQSVVDFSDGELKYDIRTHENIKVKVLPMKAGKRGKWVRDARGNFVKLSEAVLATRSLKRAKKQLLRQIAASGLSDELKTILREMVTVL